MKITIKVYDNPYINYFISVLFVLCIFCLPYDAMKILPTIYRPLSIFPLLLIFILLLPKLFKNKDKTVVFLTLFYLISLLTLFINYINDISFSFFADFFVTITLGYLIYITMNTVFKYFSKVNDFKKIFCKLISYAYVFPILIALFDFLSVNHILPTSISTLIHSIFGGGQELRVCGFTLEASWLTMHLIFCLPAMLYSLKVKSVSKFFYFIIGIDVLIIIFSFSMQAYLYIIIIAFCIWIYMLKCGMNIKIFFIPFLLVGFFALLFYFFRSIDSDIYFIKRFDNLNITYLLRNDSSSFIRIMNPIISLRMWFDHIFLGVGGGNYAIYYAEYIEKYYSYALNIYNGSNEIVYTINNLSANSKCLYTRLFAEFGIFAILYYFFLYYSIKKNNKTKIDKMLVYWLFAVIVLMIQFDSLCYFPYLLFLAFYNNIRSDNCEGIVDNSSKL